MTTATHASPILRAREGEQRTARNRALDTDSDRAEVMKDIALATLLGIAMFGASIALIMSSVKFF